MKKILSLLLCVLMLLSMPVYVYAEENMITLNNVSYDCGSMTISGSLAANDGTSLANKAITIKLARSNAGYEGIAVLDEVKTDENGEFKLTVKLPDEKDGLSDDGTATLYAKAKNVSQPAEMSAYYVKKSQREKIIAELADITSVEDMTDKLSNQKVKSALSVIGVEISYFDKLSAGMISETLIASNAFRDKSEQAVKKAVNGALWVADVNSGNSEDVLKIWNPTFRGVSFNEITDTEKRKEIISNFNNGKPYENFNALENAYSVSNILYDINRARSGEMEELLALAAECGLDKNSYSSYKNMNYAKKAVVGDNLVKSVSKSKISNITELNSLLAAAIKEADKENPRGTGGSASSSGKGSIKDIPNSTNTDISKITEPVKGVNITDMDSAEWAKEAVEALAKRGIVNGYDDGKFYPNNGVRREEFVKMLAMAIGMKEETLKCSYDDVPDDAWYYPAVAFCTDKKIVNGISGNEFGTGREITRQDMATIIYRAAISADKNLENVREYKAFDDESNIGAYALEAIKKLYAAGKLNGVSESVFLPNNICTRAQAAKIIYDVFINQFAPNDESAYVSNNTPSDNNSDGVNKINYDSRSIGVLEGLGIAAGYTSKNFDENTVVSAGRFINMLLNITCDNAYTGDTVSDEGLQRAGLYGFAGSRADAEEKSITYGNAIRLVLNLLGYKQLAEQNGGFPNGYLQAAVSASLDIQNIGLEEKLTAGAAADLIYSAIKAKPLSKDYSGGSTSYEVADDENILEYYRKIHVITGVMDRNSLTYLTNGNVSRMNYVGINGETYSVSGNTYDDLLGWSVEAYIQEDDYETQLLYAMPKKTKNKLLNIDLKDIERAENNLSAISYTEGETAKVKTVKLNSALKVIYNQKAYNSFTKDDFLNKRGQLLLIDNDGDGAYDVAKINAYEVMVVKSVTSKGVILNKFTYSGASDTLNTENIDVTVIRDGAESDIKSIREFDVLNVYQSKQKEDGFVAIYASSKTSNGTLNSMSMNDKDTSEITVGTDTYKITSELFDALKSKDSALKQLKTGNTYVVYVDCFGEAAWMDETDNITSYGYLRNVFPDDSDTAVRIELLTTDNEWRTFDCAKKINYNNESMPKDQFLTSMTSKSQLVEYRLNGKNEVVSVKTADLSGYNPEKFTTNGKNNARYCRGDYAFNSEIFLNDGAKIFVVPADNSDSLVDRDGCGVVSASYLVNEKNYDYQAYNYDEYGYSDVFVVYTSLENFKPKAETPMFLVESKEDVSADGMILTMVNGISTGSKMSVSAEADEHLFDDIEKGDIISITTGLAGKIYVQKYYDYTDDGSNDTEDLTINEWDEKRCGVLKEIDLNKRRLIIGSDAKRTMRWFKDISVSLYDAETGEVKVGSLSDLQPGDYLWIRLGWRQMQEVVAIRHK